MSGPESCRAWEPDCKIFSRCPPDTSQFVRRGQTLQFCRLQDSKQFATVNSAESENVSSSNLFIFLWQLGRDLKFPKISKNQHFFRSLRQVRVHWGHFFKIYRISKVVVFLESAAETWTTSVVADTPYNVSRFSPGSNLPPSTPQKAKT